MQNFRITRTMQYTEVAEVKAEKSIDVAKMLAEGEIEFTRNNDDFLFDEDIKYTCLGIKPYFFNKEK